MPKEKMIALLYELMKNSRRSDRDLAKILDVSQPTVTRMRKKLETSNYLLEYTIIPNLVKLGFEIVAFTFLNIARTCPEPSMSPEEFMQKTHRWIEKNKNVIFSGTGEGIRGKNSVMVSLHRDFTDYTRFVSEFRRQWAKNVLDVEGFIVTLKGKMPKSFSLRHLEQPE
jgi:DNA-binding Lrp family transcriptional regulator